MPLWKTFPPGGNLRVPLGSRRGALAALALYPAACRPRATWLLKGARGVVGLLGPRALPGPAMGWEPPVPPEAWAEWTARWRREAGPFDALAVWERPQAERAGVALLLLRGGAPVAFVKARPDRASIERERDALARVAEFAPRAFRAPVPIGGGAAGGWHDWVAAPLPAAPHRAPADPPLAAVLDEVQAALGGLPRPPDAPPSWRPMHGDFTPWNLRDYGAGRAPRLALVDWEDAGWGPPGADLVLYRAVEAALAGRAPAPVAGAGEAVDHWRAVVRARPASGRDRALADATLAALDRLAGPRTARAADAAIRGTT